jgi:hypothetical protein
LEEQVLRCRQWHSEISASILVRESFAGEFGLPISVVKKLKIERRRYVKLGFGGLHTDSNQRPM